MKEMRKIAFRTALEFKDGKMDSSILGNLLKEKSKERDTINGQTVAAMQGTSMLIELKAKADTSGVMEDIMKEIGKITKLMETVNLLGLTVESTKASL